MNPIWIFIIAIAIGVVITDYIIWKLQEFRGTDTYQKSQRGIIKLLKWEEQMVIKFQTSVLGFFSNKKIQRIKPQTNVLGLFSNMKLQRIKPAFLLEIILIGIWAFWIGQDYLNFDPSIIPSGREFSSAIQTHHVWTRFQECGWCALWNGTIRGGFPAFADIHGSMLHPFVIFSTLLLGVVNGAKFALVLSFWFAGIAQWWIARELKFSRIPRLWSSGMAVVGGHLAGRMELGIFGVVLSTAMASLVFGAILAVANGKGKRAVVLLGITTASALLAGQGYIQAGMIGAFPAILFLIINKKMRFNDLWKDYLMAFIIAGLLSAVFLIPFAHFSPNFVKDTDLEFKVAQPLKFIPLNYVIDSRDFYFNESLSKLPFPHLYTLFIGWVPILFAVYGLSNKALKKSIKWYISSSVLIILLISSGDALKLISHVWKGVGGIRHPAQIAGLTVPLILGLSAAGLDKFLKLDWPKLDFRFSENDISQIKNIPTQLIIIIPLIFSLHQGYQFTTFWIHTFEEGREIYLVLEELQTDTLQWVQPPFGDHFYTEPSLRMGLKTSSGIMTFRWKERSFPEAYLEASYTGQPVGTSEVLTNINTIVIYSRPEQEYASVINGTQITPCQAQGTGGNLAVTCDTEYNGRLVIQENNWSGWKGWMDGKSVNILGTQWISVEVPKGKHTFIFRYRPWDVPLGLVLSGAGIIMSIFLWYSNSPLLDKILKNRKDL